MKKLAQRLLSKRNQSEFLSADGTEVKILFSSENPSLLGNKIKTTAIEMSRKSIRLAVSHSIEIDSVLDISIKVNETGRTYNLTGNVRWRVPSVSNEYHIVLVLRERNDIRSDLKAWKANFQQNFTYSEVG